MTPVQHVVHIGEMKNAYKIIVSNSEGNRPFSRPWQDNINMDPVDIGCESEDWIHLAQGAVK
jgi:hypothetical protein